MAAQNPTQPPADTTEQATSPAAPPNTQYSRPKHYWRNLTIGFVSSILFHEAGHVATAYAVGAHPHFGWDKGRPTVYSGIFSNTDPHKQFLFSSAGLNVQAVLDEGILDVPHHRGAPFERGLLAGGIATAFFYATIGRNASNSDITFMARTSSLSKTQASLIYAGLATIHTIRIAHNKHYANFFLRPSQVTSSHANNKTGINIGVAILPE
jgi:hypothetical protein